MSITSLKFKKLIKFAVLQGYPKLPYGNFSAPLAASTDASSVSDEGKVRSGELVVLTKDANGKAIFKRLINADNIALISKGKLFVADIDNHSSINSWYDSDNYSMTTHAGPTANLITAYGQPTLFKISGIFINPSAKPEAGDICSVVAGTITELGDSKTYGLISKVDGSFTASAMPGSDTYATEVADAVIDQLISDIKTNINAALVCRNYDSASNMYIFEIV
jgi:hypothetical protein